MVLLNFTARVSRPYKGHTDILKMLRMLLTVAKHFPKWSRWDFRALLFWNETCWLAM